MIIIIIENENNKDFHLVDVKTVERFNTFTMIRLGGGLNLLGRHPNNTPATTH